MKFNIDKRKLIVLSLVFVLISISYLNYMINKQSLLQTSLEFKSFEENQLARLEEDMQGDEDKVVDSQSSEVEEIIAASNDNIKNNLLSKEEGVNSFLQSKLDMEIEREKTIERFDEIINNELIDEESRKNAVEKKITLIETINKEKIIESLIKGKGFEDAIVFITNNSAYVTIGGKDLTDADIAKILDIVTREANVSIENIKIR